MQTPNSPAGSEAPTSQYSKSVWDRIAKWIFFSVLVSVCPLGALYVICQEMGLNVEPSFFLTRGELQLITVVLLATGVGELIGSKETAGVVKTMKIVVGGMAIALYFMSAMWFGVISIELIKRTSTSQAGPDPLVIGTSASQTSPETLPMLFFVGAVVLGGACIVISED